MTSTFARSRQRVLPPGAGSRLVTVPDELAHLAERQHGVLRRGQLRRHGLGLAHVRAAVAAKRWQLVGRAVVVMHNAVLTQHQRFTPTDIRRGAGPPRTAIGRSVVDAAAWSASPRRACAVLRAAVQPRLTTPAWLDAELRRAGAIRHAAIIRDILGDITGGGHTLAEIGLTPLVRRSGLPAPRHQVLRREPDGKTRYVDAEIDLPDGTALAIEIDGAMHLQPSHSGTT
jgi:hypothetical protein